MLTPSGVVGSIKSRMNYDTKKDEIFKILEKGYSNLKNVNKKVMITHVHPKDSIIERFTTFFPGSSGVKKAIEKFQPDLVFVKEKLSVFCDGDYWHANPDWLSKNNLHNEVLLD